MKLPKNLRLDAQKKWEITHFDEITDFLWENRKNIKDFNDPVYGGLPKRLSSKLSIGFEDSIQYALAGVYVRKVGVIKSKLTKKEFCQDCSIHLFEQ